MNSKSIEQYNSQLINNNSYTTNNLLKQFKLINLSAKQENLHIYRRTSAEIVSEAKNMMARGSTEGKNNDSRFGSGNGSGNGNVTNAVTGQQLQNNNIRNMGVQSVGKFIKLNFNKISIKTKKVLQIYNKYNESW